MKVVDESRFETLVSETQIMHQGCQFLDGIKIGLRVRPIGRILPALVNLDTGTPVETETIDIRLTALRPGELYLLQTFEAICLPNNVFGFLHTRSSAARLGINCIGSSNYVAPGYGHGVPASFILEVTSVKTVINLSIEEPLVGLVLFESDSPLRAGDGPVNTFPFFGT